MNEQIPRGELTLAFDTSSRMLDVLLTNGKEYARRTVEAGRRHNELLAITIQELLAEYGTTPDSVSRVICCRGPGSFTGLRIGMATAKGIAAGKGIPAYAVPTLSAYRRASEHEHVICAIDGRKNRFYVEVYDGAQSVWGPADAEPSQIVTEISSVAPPGQQLFIIGPDSGAFIDMIESGDPELAERMERDDSYFSGIAPALVACVDRPSASWKKRSHDVDTPETDDKYTGGNSLVLHAGEGPDYLRPSQAEE